MTWYNSGLNLANITINNYLHNTGFDYWQVAGTSSSVTDTHYGADRWKIFCQSSTVTAARISGTPYICRLTPGASTRFGMAQIVESTLSVKWQIGA